MSLQSFQSALAYAIRSFDAENKRSLEDFIHSYELTSDEKFALENLIHQQRLKAYSEELFLARWTIIREALEFLQPFVDFKAMSDLWEHDFEAKSTNIIHEDLVLRFVDYLVFDEKGSAFIANSGKAFMPSLVRYLQAVFTFKHNYLPKTVLAPHSVLTDRYFAIITLEYDVREFFAELVELTDYKDLQVEPPPKRELTLLFVATDQLTEFRSFEIDQDLANFLTAELKGEKTEPALVQCYDDLVDMGLCKPRGIKRTCCTKVH